jgi:aminoglycoside phosphotransferase family enzyme/predicted kinase
LIERLRRGDLFEPPAGPARVIETHISWVLLAGDFAYKIKKPVNFGFVDFSTLELRRHFCEEELRLNRRAAPELYLRVVAITGTVDEPRVGGEGAALEYALVMRRFEDACRADHLLAAGSLTNEHFETFARDLQDFHARAESVGPLTCPDQPGRAQHWVLENLDQIAPFVAGTAHESDLAALRAWTAREYERLAPVLRRRQAEERVRDGHGDLHLGNLVLLQGRLRAFDCLEFNAELRRIDVASEVAFLFMDLEAHRRKDLAWRFLNAYLEAGGDYELCVLLRFFSAYRALVRVKVACLSAPPPAPGGLPDPALPYLALARSHLVPPRRPPLILMHGVSGSGKSRVALELAGLLGAVRLRSDVERRRLIGSGDAVREVEQGAYRPEATERVYRRLRELARALLDARFATIVDATFMKRAQRATFYELARVLGVPCHVVHCTAPVELLRERVGRRERAAQDASEATIPVLEHQMRVWDSLQEDEQPLEIRLDTGRPDLDAQLTAAADKMIQPGG